MTINQRVLDAAKQIRGSFNCRHIAEITKLPYIEVSKALRTLVDIGLAETVNEPGFFYKLT